MDTLHVRREPRLQFSQLQVPVAVRRLQSSRIRIMLSIQFLQQIFVHLFDEFRIGINCIKYRFSSIL